MKTIEELLKNLARAEVLEFGLVTNRLPSVNIGGKFEPVDDHAPSSERVIAMLVAIGGARHVELLSDKPVQWTTRVDGVGIVAVAAILRKDVVQARITVSKRDEAPARSGSATSPNPARRSMSAEGRPATASRPGDPKTTGPARAPSLSAPGAPRGAVPMPAPVTRNSAPAHPERAGFAAHRPRGEWDDDEPTLQTFLAPASDTQGARDPAVKAPRRPDDAPRASNAALDRGSRERLAEERAAQERAAQERAAQERAQQERAQQERAQQERAQQERAQQERAAQERAAQERAAQERAAQERAAQERAAQERAAQDRAAQERAAQDRAAQERAAQERAAQERAVVHGRAEAIEPGESEHTITDVFVSAAIASASAPKLFPTPTSLGSPPPNARGFDSGSVTIDLDLDADDDVAVLAAEAASPSPRAAGPSPSVAASPGPTVARAEARLPAVDPSSSLDSFLASAVSAKASDLFIVAGHPVAFRRVDDLVPQTQPITAEHVDRMTKDIVPSRLRDVLEHRGSCQFAIEHPTYGRFRMSVSRHRGGFALAARLVPSVTPTFETAGLPDRLALGLRHRRGIAIVAGNHRQGKSTTVAAIVEHLCRKGGRHVMTVEAPIEHVHSRGSGFVSQRDSGLHSPSEARVFATARRHDADVIVAGNVENVEDARRALTLAEGGRFVVCSMTASTVSGSLTRLLDFFRGAEQEWARWSLASSLKVVVAQRLVPSIDRSRFHLAVALLPWSSDLHLLVRDGRLAEVADLEQHTTSPGALHLDASLAALVAAGKVSAADATTHALDREAFERTLAASAPHRTEKD